ncbi:MAG: hypothetical protein PHQ78_00985 [Candidatus Cloacimonetes bacterium]|nr:hypothetical protein [Candidatus Cloacimonadota bacterium]MDD4559291.1 hypothetical protein [Candidatus Cloacimonadota bacterium]
MSRVAGGHFKKKAVTLLMQTRTSEPLYENASHFRGDSGNPQYLIICVNLRDLRAITPPHATNSWGVLIE